MAQAKVCSIDASPTSLNILLAISSALADESVLLWDDKVGRVSQKFALSQMKVLQTPVDDPANAAWRHVVFQVVNSLVYASDKTYKI